MIHLPQTLGSATCDAINALIFASDRFRNWNDAEVQSIVADIEKLRSVDAREAFVRRGSLAAICGNVDDLAESFRKALLLQNQTDTKHEYWLSLANAGLYGKCQELGTWLLDQKRGFFPKIWSLALSMGQIHDVWNRLIDAKKTYPELSQADFSVVENAVSVMNEHQLTDQDIVSVLDLMGEIQRAHKIMFSGELVATLKVMRPPEEEPYLYFSILLDASVGGVHRMNRELVKLVVEKLAGGIFPQGMVASFSKAGIQALRAAA